MAQKAEGSNFRSEHLSSSRAGMGDGMPLVDSALSPAEKADNEENRQHGLISIEMDIDF